jgi:putative tryptophan/tyrosine transport system substrate-binding protein
VAVAAKQATRTIPIVFASVGDPVALGLVESLARPGGNVTGAAALFGPLAQKRLELLKEVAPGTSHVACLYDATDPGGPATVQLVVEAARPLDLVVEAHGVQTTGDVDLAFEAATRFAADALLTTQGAALRRQAPRIVELAAKYRLPAIYAWREAVPPGGLMAYGPDTAAQFRRAAYYVDRILKGAKPADLPVEQPMKFELVINLKTAQALGLTIPQPVLLQATELMQ